MTLNAPVAAAMLDGPVLDPRLVPRE